MLAPVTVQGSTHHACYWTSFCTPYEWFQVIVLKDTCKRKVAKCGCLDKSALRTVIMRHVLRGTSLWFKVERILNCPRREYSPNLRLHGCQCSWVDFCLIVLLSYFSDCEMPAFVADWIRIAIKILHVLVHNSLVYNGTAKPTSGDQGLYCRAITQA